MNLGEVRSACRTKIDDVARPYLWSDDLLNGWINDAVAEVCLRARSLQDSTSKFLKIPIRVGVNRYELDPSILVIKRAKLASYFMPLTMTTMAILDQKIPTWDDPKVTAIPQYGFTNKDYSDHLTLYISPYPYQNDTLNLTVWRMPTECERLTEDEDDVPLPLHYHKDLEYWIEHKAFEQKDAETFDPDRSLKAMAIFTDRYGERPSAHELKLMGTNRLRGTRPDYF